MGGRGGASGISNKIIGFTFKRGGKENYVEKVNSKHVLLNGKLVEMDYDTAKRNAKKMNGYKVYTEKDKRIREKKREKIRWNESDEISAIRSIRRKERKY